MAELPPFPDTAEDADTRPDGDAPPGIPGWVKLFGIILLTLILLLVIIMVSGAGGRHGPGRHGPGRHTPAADVPALAAATEIVADEWLVSARPRLSEELVQR